MTADECSEILDRIEISRAWLAEACGIAPSTIWRWTRGDLVVPRWAALLLSAIDRGLVGLDDLDRLHQEICEAD